MKRVLFLSVIVSGILVFLATGPIAGSVSESKNQGATKAATVSEDGQAVLYLAAAQQVAEWGRRNENPAALLVAAQMLKSVPAAAKEVKKEVKGKPEEDSGEKKGSLDTPEVLLDEAAKMAKGKEPELFSTIEKEKSVKATKGEVRGPGRVIDRVSRNSRHIYDDLVFVGGELAAVYVEGDGDSDLDLFVYDENGHLIGSDEDMTDACLVRWNPRWTGQFVVVIVNHGPMSNMYKMVWN